jgi:xylulokinase
MTLALGIDVGTSAVKVVLIGAGEVLAQADMPLEIIRPKPGWSEQHPDQWIAGTRAALAKLRRDHAPLLGRVAAIGLSGQMHGSVLLGCDQRPLMTAILWNDFRASAEAASIQSDWPDLATLAGVMCVAGFVAPKLLWLRRHEPEIIAKVRTLILPKDYVRLWLTGETATDVVDASGSWFLDQRSRQWSSNVLSCLGIDAAILPPVLESPVVSGVLRGPIASELGLPPGIPVVAGAGDAGAGGLGLGMISEGEAFISLGTSAQFFAVTTGYRPSISTLIHAFAHAIPGRWFQMAAMLNGASALAWWSAICGQDPGMLIEEAARRPFRSDDPLFLPYLMGERTPHNDPDARGAFIGLSSGTERDGMTRAVMEGVAFCLADAQAAMRQAGTVVDTLGLTGGGARSAYWAQLVADALKVNIVRYRSGEVGPALGAAKLALAGLGQSTAEVFAKPPILDRLEPSKDRYAAMQPRLARWRLAYLALRDELEVASGPLGPRFQASGQDTPAINR